MNEVLGNHISLTLTTLLTTGEQIKAGKLVPLAVSSLERHPAYPDIPTFAEQGFPDVRGDTWFWLAGPRKSRRPSRLQLNAEMRRINASPKMREHIATARAPDHRPRRRRGRKFVADEYAFWAPLAKEVGLAVQ